MFIVFFFMQKNIPYVNNILTSFRLVFSNLSLFVPDFLFFLFMSLSGSYLLVINGLFPSIASFTNPEVLGKFLVDKIKFVLSNSPSLIKLLVSIVIFIMFNIIFGIGTSAFRYVMIGKLVKNKKFEFFKSFRESKKFWFKIFGIKFIIFLLYFLVFLVLFLFIFLLVKLGFVHTIIAILLSIPLLLVFFVVLLYLSLLTIFIYPILFFNNSNVIKTLKDSFLYFKNNRKNTLLTFLIITLINITASWIIYFLANIFQSLSTLFLKGIVLFVIIIVMSIIKNLAAIVISLWVNLIIFKNY